MKITDLFEHSKDEILNARLVSYLAQIERSRVNVPKWIRLFLGIERNDIPQVSLNLKSPSFAYRQGFRGDFLKIYINTHDKRIMFRIPNMKSGFDFKQVLTNWIIKEFNLPASFDLDLKEGFMTNSYISTPLYEKIINEFPEWIMQHIGIWNKFLEVMTKKMKGNKKP